MTYWIFLPLTALVINGFFFTYVFAQPRKSALNRAYLFLIGSFMTWAAFEFIEQLPMSASALAVLVKLVPLSWGYVGFAAIHFCYSLLERRKDLIYKASIVSLGILAFLTFSTNLVLESFEKRSWGMHEVDGILTVPIIAVNIAVPVSFLLFLIWRERTRTAGVYRRTLGNIFTGATISLALGLTTEVILPLTLGPNPFELASISTVFMAFFVHRAMVQHRFLTVGIEEAAVEIFETSTFGIVITQSKNHKVSLNNEARRIADLIADLQGISGEAAIELLAVETTEKTFDERSFGPDGQSLFVQFHSTPIYKGSSSAGTLLILKEVTAERESEAEKQRLEDHLRQSQKLEALGTLAGGVAHDMNNVLTGILGCASVLLSEIPSGTSQAADIMSILKSARRGKDLTSNLLGFARKTKPTKKPVSINSAAQEVLPMLKRTFSKSIEIGYRSDGNLMDVEADEGQLNQLIMNLCINAKDATAGGGQISISTRLVSLPGDHPSVSLPAGEYALLTVEDDGDGMDEETRSRALEPFFTTKELGKGTGLGLAMVYGIVKSHDGDVTITSTLGEGTRVDVFLPLLGLSDRASLPSPGPTTLAEDWSSYCVLIVDDENLVRRTAKRILEKMGCRVLEAENGAEAVEIFRELHQDIGIVLLDMSMPVMGGVECFSELKRIDEHARIVISSGFSRDPEAEVLIRSGAAGHLAKPYEMSHFLKVMTSSRDTFH